MPDPTAARAAAVAAEAPSRFRVPFRDVDMHGHVHNGVYLSYFESAINELLRRFDLLKYFEPGSASHRYHVRKAELVYSKPVGFDALVEVQAALARIGTTSLTFSARLDREGDADDAEPSVAATIVWVCVDAGSSRPVPVPEATRAALAVLCGDSGSVA